MNPHDKNYYEILEIPTHADAEEVHQGYLRSKNAYNHDSLALYSLMSKEECEKILEMINEAYSIISDPDKRLQYDRARGINQHLHSTQNFSVPRENYSISKSEQNSVAAGSAHYLEEARSNPMTRNIKNIVASNRFKLDYNTNDNLEQEIEKTTEFTGEFLRKIREYKNVDIRRMAEMTKVSKLYLTNIEDDDLKKLPALVYVRGFVYQYAKCLKLNPDFVATSYIHHIKRLQEDQSQALA